MTEKNRSAIDLARAEVVADAQRGKADATWRTAWWDTTLAVGSLPKNGSGAVVAEVASILGCSNRSVTGRRVVGARIFTLGCKNIHTLPPRMLLEIPAKQFNLETIELAREAEAEGMSLREFSAMLTGKAWADTPAGASADTIKEIISTHPDLVGKLVGESAEVSKAVVESWTPVIAAHVVAEVSDAAFEELNDALVTATTATDDEVTTGGVTPAYTPSPAKIKAVHKTAAAALPAVIASDPKARAAAKAKVSEVEIEETKDRLAAKFGSDDPAAREASAKVAAAAVERGKMHISNAELELAMYTVGDALQKWSDKLSETEVDELTARATGEYMDETIDPLVRTIRDQIAMKLGFL